MTGRGIYLDYFGGSLRISLFVIDNSLGRIIIHPILFIMLSSYVLISVPFFFPCFQNKRL